MYKYQPFLAHVICEGAFNDLNRDLPVGNRHVCGRQSWGKSMIELAQKTLKMRLPYKLYRENISFVTRWHNFWCSKCEIFVFLCNCSWTVGHLLLIQNLPCPFCQASGQHMHCYQTIGGEMDGWILFNTLCYSVNSTKCWSNMPGH